MPSLYPTLMGASVRRLTVAHFKILCHVQLEINVPQDNGPRRRNGGLTIAWIAANVVS